MKKSLPRPPKGLSAAARRLWADLAGGYSITDSGGLVLLQTACEAFDRYQSARARIDRDGAAVADRWGQLKPHPLLACERDARAALLAALKALRLDIEPVKRPGSPGLGGIGVTLADR